MKHWLLNTFLFYICANTNAQRFYIEPMVLAGIKKYSAQGRTFNEYSITHDEVFYRLGSPTWQIDRKMNVGFSLGIKGEMFHFESGFFTGQITSMAHIKLGVGPEEKVLEYYQDMNVYRVNINSGLKAFYFGKNEEPNALQHELWLRLGMDIVLNRSDYYLYQVNAEKFQLSDIKFNVTESYAYGDFNYLLMLNFGMKYRLNKGLKNIICLNIYYCYRQDRVGGALFRNISIEHNSAASSGRVDFQPPSGLSGFYFGISKEFFFGERCYKPKENQLE